MLAFSPLFLTFVASALALPQAKRAKTHTIKVGDGGKLAFYPVAIFADIGDEVIFQFTSKNHSVIQSSFADPCGPVASGFKTDFQFVAPGLSEAEFPTVKYTVSETEPLWFYCSQANHTPNSHCKKGMVFAINCPVEGEKSFDNFKAKALASDADKPVAAPADGQPTDAIVPAVPEPTYAGITIPPAETAATKTDVITLGTSTWTTTYASYPNSPDPTPASVDGDEIKVIVGKDNQLVFEPAHVEAKPRDRIVFEFQSKNHSVVQSSFAAPCTPLASLIGGASIDSGFMAVAAGSSQFPQFTVTVNDTTPLYFYCGQTGHCGKGMVFSINTNEKGSRSYSAFQTLAQEINGTDSSAPSTGGYGGGNSASRASTAGFAMLAAAALAVLAL
ncbi:hypothetical protein AURDEDRAFT_111594 [Auricularia subglabra TFB-10046 SS5]|nr:hypothetical protein AURDEDRAFT_111594 [Auricularia subglabra TFB-10046 SS5]